ncbi:BTAD domain-containing putative transcriptional regulator [Kitasatospora sp. NPDC097643]|uniref:AfsR/SARP family transcriptional regulator n=1 Tax=Kitasatospora sp. NPDC097643 TaxID=3157230 RepID=UPI00331B8245
MPIQAGRQRSLLAALLMRPNQLVSMDSLIGAVWDDTAPPADGPAALRNYVARLRRALGPEVGARIVTRSPGYLIEVGDEELDVLRFAELHRRARATSAADRPTQVARELTEALSLWRGTPLADIPARGYHQNAVRRLHEMRLEALERRIDADLLLGAHREVIGELRALTAAHRTREPFHRQLMLALYRSDCQAEALDVFQGVRQNLVEELGIEPGDALRDLHRRILAGDRTLDPPPVAPDRAAGRHPSTAPPAARVPAEVPAGPRDFTGRERQVEDLVARLGAPRGGAAGLSEVVTVAGPAGVGKSALARHVAHLVRGEFPDGQLYANLRGSTGDPVPPAEVLTRFLRSLGTEASAVPTDPDELASLFRTAMADRRALVVLDDAADAGQVHPLLPGSGATAVLITSRSHLADLEGASRVHLRGMDALEATGLFGRIAGPDTLTRDAAAVAAVLDVCAGLPVAIRIAASRLDAGTGLTVADLAEQLADPATRLDALRVGDLAVRPVITSACTQLTALPTAEYGDPDPAYVFRALRVFAESPFIAATVAQLLGRPTGAVQQALDHLVNAGTVVALPAGLYRLHPLLAAYVAERAGADPAARGCADPVGRPARHPAEGGLEGAEGAGDAEARPFGLPRSRVPALAPARELRLTPLG